CTNGQASQVLAQKGYRENLYCSYLSIRLVDKTLVNHPARIIVARNRAFLYRSLLVATNIVWKLRIFVQKKVIPLVFIIHKPSIYAYTSYFRLAPWPHALRQKRPRSRAQGLLSMAIRYYSRTVH